MVTSFDYSSLLERATRVVSEEHDLNQIYINFLGFFDQLLEYECAVGIYIQDNESLIQSVDSKKSEYSLSDVIGQKIECDFLMSVNDMLEQRFFIFNENKCSFLESFNEMNSFLVFPLANSRDRLGAFIFAREQEDAFDEDVAQSLLVFVNLAIGAIQNAKLISTITQNADELATLYHATSVLFHTENLEDFAYQITEVITRTFRYTDCGLLLFNGDTGDITAIKRAGVTKAPLATHQMNISGQGLIPKAVREQRLIYEPDVRQSEEYYPGQEQILSELVAPLKSVQGILGVLDFQSDQLNAFSEKDRRLLVAFAERVIPILENVLLYDELKQYANQLEVYVAERTLELERTKEQLETIIRSSPDAIVLLDNDGLIKQANISWLSMTGLSFPEVIDQPLVHFLNVSDQSSFMEALTRTIHDELENDLTVKLSNRNNRQEIEVEISIAPVLEGHSSGVVCNIRDVTHHKTTERVLRDALVKSEELSDLKTNFVTMASHEFRTPLTTILSSSDIVATYYNKLSPENIAKHMEKIMREVNYLNDLIDDILVIGRNAETGFSTKYEVINLIELVRVVVSRIKTNDQNRHRIQVKIPQKCESIVVDKKLISYILDNLLNNACKYSRESTTVELTININHDDLQVIVRDYGIGIPQDDLDKLFVTFHRGSNVGNIRGTGIGLAIVHEAVVALGGSIDVQSQIDEGTLVSVEIPIPELSVVDTDTNDLLE